MISKFLKWLFLHKCEVCKVRTNNLYWFYESRGKIYEKVCEDCVRIDKIKQDPLFHQLVEEAILKRSGH